MQTLRRDQPCWYDLSWKPQNPAGVTLKLQQELLAYERPISKTAPIVGQYMEDLGLNNFEPDFRAESGFGFDSTFKLLAETSESLDLLIPFPTCQTISTRKCLHCADQPNSQRCVACNNTGKEIDYNSKVAYAISATLSLLTFWLRLPKSDTSSKLPQLMVINTATKRGAHGGIIMAELSNHVARYLTSKGADYTIAEMVATMQQAWKTMMPFDSVNAGRCNAHVRYETGWLNIDCPGSGSGMNPSQDVRANEGYVLSPHNIDGPVQQLTLFAGLATLNALVRQHDQI